MIMGNMAHRNTYSPHQLTRRVASDSMDAVAGALLDAQVDLNPHQIDAALFATGNPLAKGSILADEVGLGKTIEAGLLIAQRWAERKRRIEPVCKCTLRRQVEAHVKYTKRISLLQEFVPGADETGLYTNTRLFAVEWEVS